MDNEIPQAYDWQGHWGKVERAHTTDMYDYVYTDNTWPCEPRPCTLNDICSTVYKRIGNDEAHKGTGAARLVAEPAGASPVGAITSIAP